MSSFVIVPKHKCGYLEMELAVDWVAFSVDQFKSVGTVAIHVSVAIRKTPVTEQE